MDVDSLIAETLEHSGVKGMRWGVRRKRRASSGSVTPKPKGAKVKTVKDISDADLKQLVSRLQMEQQFAKLAGSGAQKTRKRRSAEFLLKHGSQIVGEVLKNEAKAALTRQIQSDIAKKAGKVAANQAKGVAKNTQLSLFGAVASRV
jgi:Ribonuclease G/E